MNILPQKNLCFFVMILRNTYNLLTLVVQKRINWFAQEMYPLEKKSFPLGFCGFSICLKLKILVTFFPLYVFVLWWMQIFVVWRSFSALFVCLQIFVGCEGRVIINMKKFFLFDFADRLLKLTATTVIYINIILWISILLDVSENVLYHIVPK